ncbi:hypothetical protein P0W64_16380 [Tsukamurella sp. 8F]|uniref:hypothetical protein n=1 Tax=unclassified Tsukamurella TaxID=2633480 RepID=UPI0023B97E19|nr:MULTISPECIES: hypothetical protein [unclassified Tsukamurella]MDF0531112.1 hypothetical protein [Tsukamurella sp. 8J]MDF0588358.1 hypothetical protein [Tsukamurella sp. 8F]
MSDTTPSKESLIDAELARVRDTIATRVSDLVDAYREYNELKDAARDIIARRDAAEKRYRDARDCAQRDGVGADTLANFTRPPTAPNRPQQKRAVKTGTGKGRRSIANAQNNRKTAAAQNTTAQPHEQPTGVPA